MNRIEHENRKESIRLETKNSSICIGRCMNTPAKDCCNKMCKKCCTGNCIRHKKGSNTGNFTRHNPKGSTSNHARSSNESDIDRDDAYFQIFAKYSAHGYSSPEEMISDNPEMATLAGI